jgi:hypothetical protein
MNIVRKVGGRRIGSARAALLFMCNATDCDIPMPVWIMLGYCTHSHLSNNPKRLSQHIILLTSLPLPQDNAKRSSDRRFFSVLPSPYLRTFNSTICPGRTRTSDNDADEDRGRIGSYRREARGSPKEREPKMEAADGSDLQYRGRYGTDVSLSMAVFL